jgi:hypothetical protein
VGGVSASVASVQCERGAFSALLNVAEGVDEESVGDGERPSEAEQHEAGDEGERNVIPVHHVQQPDGSKRKDEPLRLARMCRDYLVKAASACTVT